MFKIIKLTTSVNNTVVWRSISMSRNVLMLNWNIKNLIRKFENLWSKKKKIVYVNLSLLNVSKRFFLYHNRISLKSYFICNINGLKNHNRFEKNRKVRSGQRRTERFYVNCDFSLSFFGQGVVHESRLVMSRNEKESRFA